MNDRRTNELFVKRGLFEKKHFQCSSKSEFSKIKSTYPNNLVVYITEQSICEVYIRKDGVTDNDLMIALSAENWKCVRTIKNIVLFIFIASLIAAFICLIIAMQTKGYSYM